MDEITTMREALQLIGHHGDLLSTHEMYDDDPPHMVFPGGVVAHAGPSDHQEFAIVMTSVDFTRCARYTKNHLCRFYFRRTACIPTQTESMLRAAVNGAIEASDNDGGSASDAIQDMLAILVPVVATTDSMTPDPA